MPLYTPTIAPRRPRRHALIPLVLLFATIVAVALGLTFLGPNAPSVRPFPGPFFIASIDTMKESMDTDAPGRQLNDGEIASDVGAAGRLGGTHITVDTYWDYPGYMGHWVAAVRATGKHVWFRLHPSAWEGDNGMVASLAPTDYLRLEQDFIASHSSLFRPGDILDPCPEPENSPYWRKVYGPGWTSQRAAADAYNNFIEQTTNIAQRALRHAGVRGVATTIRSTSAWFALHPAILYPSTIAHLGVITVDSYPDGASLDPANAARARVLELDAIERVRRVPVVLGEMGYSTRMLVDDATQQAVLAAEFVALRPLPYLVGVNYWVGAGSARYDGTRLFAGVPGNWSLRPAAHEVAAFYGVRTRTNRASDASAASGDHR